MDAGTLQPLTPRPTAASARSETRPPALPFEQVASALVKSAQVAPGPAPDHAPVTTEERDYFEHLFPASSAEVRAYPTYSPAGLRQGPAASGTIIDRKG